MSLSCGAAVMCGQGVLLHLDASEDPAIRNAVFLKPKLSQSDLVSVLDVHADKIKQQIAATETELARVNAAVTAMDEFAMVVKEKARKSVRTLSLAAGVGMVVQWGVIFQFVYDVSGIRERFADCCLTTAVMCLHHACFPAVLVGHYGADLLLHQHGLRCPVLPAVLHADKARSHEFLHIRALLLNGHCQSPSQAWQGCDLVSE